MEQIKISKDVQVGADRVATVSAREVFSVLGGHPGSFPGWIGYRIKKHGFKPDADYITSVNEAYYGQKDYHVTLRMAAVIARDGGYRNTASVASYLESLLPAKVDVTPARVAVFSPPQHLSSVKTMSSVEIVEVINNLRGAGKAELRHDNFMAKVAGHPGINGLNFQGVYLDPKGEQRPCYYLPKREAELMVMSESLEVQTRVYDRLAVLEATAVPALPQTYAQALMELALNVQKTEALALENAAKSQQIEQQAAVIETQQPSVDFVDKYVATDGLQTFRSVAKLLGAKEMDFRAFLTDRKIMHRQNGEWQHAARFGDNGTKCFTTRTGISTTSGKQYNYSYFTPKGVEWVARQWKERVPMLTRKPMAVPNYTSYNV